MMLGPIIELAKVSDQRIIGSTNKSFFDSNVKTKYFLKFEKDIDLTISLKVNVDSSL